MKNKIIAIFVISVFLCSTAFAFQAMDPSKRSLNARVVGLGRAFVALADDPAAIFFNPAGLATEKSWGVTSMSGKFLDDYNYTSIAGFYPTNIGVFGLGYGGYSAGGALPTKIVAGSDPADPIYEVDLSSPQMNNSNSAFMLSFASAVDRVLPQFPFTKQLFVGGTFKKFSVELAGDSIVNGSGSGSEMDLGMLYFPMPAVRLGASALNLLPGSMGGQLTYASGHVENYPLLVKIGTAIKILGNSAALRSFANQELQFVFDIDSNPTIASSPTLFHVGLEWTVHPMVALRIGLDQSAADDGTGKSVAVGDMTYGVGVNYSGFRFDYAYHQFNNLPLDNSYFSFSYAPVIKAKEDIKDKVAIVQPADKTITFDQTSKVKGKVNISDIKSVEINNNKINLSKQNSFEAESPLSIGKNKLEVKSYGTKGKIALPIDVQNIRILRLATFPDVADNYWERQPISLISMLNIVTGYPDGSFRPEGNITRAEMAALLMRSTLTGTNDVSSRATATVQFKDVKSNHWASQFIENAAKAKVVEGYPDKSFKPKGNITRAEGLAMISRFAGVSKEVYAYQYFPDVDQKFWASSIIAGSSKAGLLEFLKGKPFEPKKNLTRAEAVEMLYRTVYVKQLLDRDLLNWDSY